MPVIFDGLGTLKPDGTTAVLANTDFLGNPYEYISYSVQAGNYSNPPVSAKCQIEINNANVLPDRFLIRNFITYSYTGNVHLQSALDEWTITIQYE